MSIEKDKLGLVKTIPKDYTRSKLIFKERGRNNRPGKHSKSDAEQTVSSFSQTAVYVCNSCNIIFFKKKELVSHITNTHPQLEENYTQSKLLFKDSGKKNRPEKHSKRDAEQTVPGFSQTVYVCNSCNVIFFIKKELVLHITNSHPQLEENQDSHTKQYPEKTTVIQNKKNNNKDKPFTCEICNIPFKLKSSLTRHVKCHTGVKLFGCTECGKDFAQKVTLQRHMRLHTGEKPYTCAVCNQQFRQRQNFLNHKRVHTGEKPYCCRMCDMRFRYKHILISHRRTHTGEMPYACDICGKKFKHKDSYASHERYHTGEKPFGCDVCGKHFNRSASHRRHMRIHTGVKPYTCAHCDDRFIYKTTLVKHIKCEHTGEY